MTMDTLKICGTAIIASVCALMVRELGRELDAPIKLAAVILLFGIAAVMAVPLIAYINEMAADSSLGDNARVLSRALAVAFAVRMASDICRECGASGVASALETVGGIELLLLAIPILRQAFELISGLVGGG